MQDRPELQVAAWAGQNAALGAVVLRPKRCGILGKKWKAVIGR